MNITLHKTNTASHLPTIQAPPSKSDAHRLLILAALSETDGPICLCCRDTNADIDATVDCLCALGADIRKTKDGFSVMPIDRTTIDRDREIALCVGESGSTLRFLIPVIGALGVSAVIQRNGRLPDRPLFPLDAVLTRHGMTLCDDPDDKSLLHLRGQLIAGDYEIDGGISSQFITGLLFALPMLDAPSNLRITGTISSAPYLALTHSALARFGYSVSPTDDGHTYVLPARPYALQKTLSVEGDWSGAAFLLCAGAMRNGVCVSGLNRDSVQGDRRILDILTMAGCRVAWNDDTVTVLPPKDGILRPITVDADDIPDLVPPIAMLCCAAVGRSEITGCSRLRIKESDRLAAVIEMITALGGNADAMEDTLILDGTGVLSGGSCNGVNDHRMVMSAALASLISTADVTVSDRGAIAKSYPRFFDDFSVFGVRDADEFR